MKIVKMNYFDEFEKNAEFAVESSNILYEFLKKFEYEKTAEIEDRVHKIEHSADRRVHAILNYLIKDFLPPIDRDDIIRITHRIDDVIDYIDEVTINLDILDVHELRPEAIEFAKLVVESSNALKEMLVEFKNIKKLDSIHELIVEVNTVEEKGDKLYQDAIRTLYKTNKNPIDVDRWWILYNCLENCLDACEKVADVVEEIITKNS